MGSIPPTLRAGPPSPLRPSGLNPYRGPLCPRPAGWSPRPRSSWPVTTRRRLPRRSGPSQPSRHHSHPRGPRPARGQLRTLRQTPSYPPLRLGPVAALPRGPGPPRAPCAPALSSPAAAGPSGAPGGRKGAGDRAQRPPVLGPAAVSTPSRVPQRPLAPGSVASRHLGSVPAVPSRWVGAGVHYGCRAPLRSG